MCCSKNIQRGGRGQSVPGREKKPTLHTLKSHLMTAPFIGGGGEVGQNRKDGKRENVGKEEGKLGRLCKEKANGKEIYKNWNQGLGGRDGMGRLKGFYKEISLTWTPCT